MAEKATVAKKRVEAANALDNPLHSALKNYKCPDGEIISLKCNKVRDLGRKTLNWIFDLMERNMKSIYEETWGWNPEKKQQELTEPAAWYLIATDSNGKSVGFSHFRFDMDYGEEVLYWYYYYYNYYYYSVLFLLNENNERNAWGMGKKRCFDLIIFCLFFSQLRITDRTNSEKKRPWPLYDDSSRIDGVGKSNAEGYSDRLQKKLHCRSVLPQIGVRVLLSVSPSPII